jgi:hypothetical protein
MNARIFPIAGAWIATVAVAYYLGVSGQSAKSPALVSSNRPGASSSSDGELEKASEVTGERAKGESGKVGDVKLALARARAELGSGMAMFMNFGGMLRAMAPLGELTDAQVQEALDEVERSVRDPQQRMLFYSLLLGQWAETDGPAALAYAREKIKDQGPFSMGATMSVVSTWSRRDPDGAWKWYLEARDRGERGPMGGMETFLPSIFAGLVATNVDAAFAKLSTLQEHERQSAANGLSMAAMDPSLRRSLLDRASGLPEETRKMVYRNVLQSWSMMDGEGAMTWIETLPQAERQELVSQAGFGFMMSDPEKGAEILLRNASPESKKTTYQTIVSQWVGRAPQAAGEWLSKQPPGPELDGARSSFSMGVMNRDPAAAMDWARSIQDEGSRQAMVGTVYGQWKVRDAAAANSALDKSGLSPAIIKSIREGTPAGGPAATERP